MNNDYITKMFRKKLISQMSAMFYLCDTLSFDDYIVYHNSKRLKDIDIVDTDFGRIKIKYLNKMQSNGFPELVIMPQKEIVKDEGEK